MIPAKTGTTSRKRDASGPPQLASPRSACILPFANDGSEVGRMRDAAGNRDVSLWSLARGCREATPLWLPALLPRAAGAPASAAP